MSRGLPLSLWKYVLAELWRVILLSAGVLVAVIAFAVAVKPLADGKLTPEETLRFMGFAIVPMLQYALPFAAGFGATLAYHRLSHDNEVVAAYAGGVSHRAVLMPAIVSGLVLSGVILTLNQQVIPRFLQSMEKLIAADITKILMKSIERGQALDVGGMVVYADRAARVEPMPGTGARDEMALVGVAALELDRQGYVTSDATAASARVWVFPGDRPDQNLPGQTAALVSMRLQDVVGAQQGKWMGQVQSVPIAVPAPGGFKDDPKFLTFKELLELRTQPERMNWIEQRRRDLAVHLGERLVTRWIDEQLRAKGSVTFRDEAGESVTLVGAAIEYPSRLRWDVLPSKEGKPVEIRLTRPAAEGSVAGVTVINAKTAGLYTDIGPSREERELTVRLEAENALTTGRLPTSVVSESVPAAGSGGGERRRLTLPGLKPVDGPVEALLDPARTPPAELLKLVEPFAQQERERALQTPAGQRPAYFVVPPNDELRRSIASLTREISSKQHERFAGAAACFVMVVSGALIAVNLSQSLPLTVYLWSFFPALVTVITISSGQQLTHQHGWPGLLLLWGGVGLLTLYTLVGYWKLARH